MTLGSIDRTSLRRFYETSTDYLRMLQHGGDMTPAERDAYIGSYVALVREAAPFPEATLLDVGCGTGETSRRLSELGLRVTALDWSELFLRSGASDRRRGAVRSLVADAEALPFAASTFDVVASLDLLEHTTSPERVLSEMARVLRDDGVIVVRCPNLLTPLRPIWYLARAVLTSRGRSTLSAGTVRSLQEIGTNARLTFGKLLFRRPGFLARTPRLATGRVVPDADATYWSSAVDIRRWLEAHGYRVRSRVRVSNDNVAQRAVRLLFPDLVSPIALVGRRTGWWPASSGCA